MSKRPSSSNRLLWFLILLIAIALPGCGTIFTPTGTLPVDTSLSPQLQKAQSAIEEAKVAIAAGYKTVADDLNNRVMTSAEAQPYVDQLDKAWTSVKTADGLLKSGDAEGAQLRADAVRQGIILLQKELAAKAKGG